MIWCVPHDSFSGKERNTSTRIRFWVGKKRLKVDWLPNVDFQQTLCLHSHTTLVQFVWLYSNFHVRWYKYLIKNCIFFASEGILVGTILKRLCKDGGLITLLIKYINIYLASTNLFLILILIIKLMYFHFLYF